MSWILKSSPPKNKIYTFDYVHSKKGLLIKPRTSHRHSATYITDFDYADDIAIPSSSVNDAEALLHAVEDTAACVEFKCNSAKTEFIFTAGNTTMSVKSGAPVKHVDNFKYLGSWIFDSEF